jgi:hypothetical protein
MTLVSVVAMLALFIKLGLGLLFKKKKLHDWFCVQLHSASVQAANANVLFTMKCHLTGS